MGRSAQPKPVGKLSAHSDKLLPLYGSRRCHSVPLFLFRRSMGISIDVSPPSAWIGTSNSAMRATSRTGGRCLNCSSKERSRRKPLTCCSQSFFRTNFDLVGNPVPEVVVHPMTMGRHVPVGQVFPDQDRSSWALCLPSLACQKHHGHSRISFTLVSATARTSAVPFALASKMASITLREFVMVLRQEVTKRIVILPASKGAPACSTDMTMRVFLHHLNRRAGR